MGCLALLRKWGLLNPVADEDFDKAVAENLLRDNEEAFRAQAEEYSKVPAANDQLKRSIRKSASPFADLERMMRKGRTL